MSVIAGERVIVRGAPEAVFARSESIGNAEQAVSRMAERGLRVVAIAARDLGPGEMPESPDVAERALSLLGLVGIEDPPEPASRIPSPRVVAQVFVSRW